MRTSADIKDSRYADALFQFVVYMYENRSGSRHDMSSVSEPKVKGPAAAKRK